MGWRMESRAGAKHSATRLVATDVRVQRPPAPGPGGPKNIARRIPRSTKFTAPSSYEIAAAIGRSSALRPARRRVGPIRTKRHDEIPALVGRDRQAGRRDAHFERLELIRYVVEARRHAATALRESEELAFAVPYIAPVVRRSFVLETHERHAAIVRDQGSQRLVAAQLPIPLFVGAQTRLSALSHFVQ